MKWDASSGLNVGTFESDQDQRSIPMARVPASETTRKRVKQMLNGGNVDHSAMIREAVRLIIEETLEAEVTDAVGRTYNAHGSAGRGQRNGYRIGKLDVSPGCRNDPWPATRRRPLNHPALHPQGVARIRNSLSG